MKIRMMLFAVLFSIGTPLLAVADLWVSTVQTNGVTLPPPPNGSITVNFVVQNIGNQTAFNFVIAGYSNRSTSCTNGLVFEDQATISQLGPGQQIQGSYILHARQGDTRIYGVVKADVNNVVTESNEGNNCNRTFALTVRYPDLHVLSTVGPTPNMVVPGGDGASFTATIKNKEYLGTGSGYMAGTSYNRYYISTATTNPPLADRLPVQIHVPPLDVNEQYTANAFVSVPVDFPLGTYNIFAQADGNLEIVEGNESNNVSSPRTLEVVDFCTLADVNEDGTVNTLDLVLIVNDLVSLVNSGNARRNIKPSPFPLPEVIDSVDLFAALPCVFPNLLDTGSGGALVDFSVQAATGGGYEVGVDLIGNVSAVETYVKLPAGFSWNGASPYDSLASGFTNNIVLASDERLLTNEFYNIIPTSTTLGGVVMTAWLEATPAIDLTALETVTPSDFTSGIAVHVLFDDGATALILKKWAYLDLPDPVLRAHLTGFFGLPAGSAIPLALAQSTTLLDLSDLNITDLTGITAFKNLQFLICPRNQLTTLPDLTALDDLIYLEAGDNQLRTISGLPDSLQVLGLDSNQLTSLPDLPVNSSLITLVVSRNELTHLPDLDGASNLVLLDFNNNQVSSLPALPASLTQLYADRNHLDDITSLGGQIFDVLDVGYNQLYDMGTLTSLTYAPGASVFVYHNNLDSYDCEVISQLLWKAPGADIYPQAFTTGCKKGKR